MSTPQQSPDFLGEIINLAQDYVAAGGVRVQVKTNLGPAIPVYSGQGEGRGLVDLLGIKAGVIVTDKRGDVIARYGNPAPTDPVKVALVVGMIALLGVILIRGVLPRK